MQGSINFDGSLVGNITGGGGGGGDTVVITPVVTSGTKIADVSVNGVEKDLYCPTPPTPPEVDITPVVTSGTKIADVSVNGVEKDLYAPNYGADITALDGRLDTAEYNITGLTTRMRTAEDNITSLTGRVGTAEGNITEIKQSLSQLDGLIIYKDLAPTDDYAEFNDGSNLPLLSLISTIEPIQSGSGTPSPDNPRPISGHTDIDIIVSPNSDFSGGNTYSVNFVNGGNPLTVYGGTLDLVSGVLTVDREMLTLNGSEAYYSIQSSSADDNTVLRVATGHVCKQNENQKSNYGTYNNNAWQQLASRVNTFVLGSEGNLYLQIPSSTASTVEEFRALFASNPLQVCYELTTPITIQLTPTQVKSLLGENYISSDVGDITNVKYLGILNFSY